jgi:Icc protein
MKTTPIKPPSTKLLWLSDLHLDYASPSRHNKLLCELKTSHFDAAVITGDTADSKSLIHHLEILAIACSPKPLYIVLGNHDFFGSSLDQTKSEVRKLCSKIDNLHHLQDHGAVWLSTRTILLGHHGWADAKCGWGSQTHVRNPDHWSIADFRNLIKSERFELMKKLGKDSTQSIRSGLNSVLRKRRHLIIATHVPPFESSAHYNGKPCGPCHSAHFVNSSMGGMLIGTARHNPNTKFTTISGHTHSPVQEYILENLESRVAGVKRGRPQIQDILTV